MILTDADAEQDESPDQTSNIPVGNLATTETEDVKNFVRICLRGHGIYDMMFKFLLHLSRKSDLCWYEGVAEVYLQLYNRLRNHLTVPTLHLCPEEYR